HVDGQVLQIQDSAGLAAPSLLVERLSDQGGATKGRAAPKVVAAARWSGHLFVGKLVDRLPVLPLGKPEPNSRTGPAQQRRLGTVPQRLRGGSGGGAEGERLVKHLGMDRAHKRGVRLTGDFCQAAEQLRVRAAQIEDVVTYQHRPGLTPGSTDTL